MEIYVGLVEENIDPKKQGRIKVRIMGVFDQIPIEDLPWSSPFNATDGKSFHTPAIGKLVSIVFIKNNIYAPYYIDAENYNVNLRDRLDDMDDENYVNFSALLYDHRTQIYSDDDELKIDYYFNNISINTESINFDLKDNNQKINIGDKEKSTQQALFGNHWLEWFDKIVDELIKPSTLIGNTGGPILRPTIDKLLSEYKLIRKTFISNNIFLVDNNKVKEDPQNHKRKYETKTYTHDVNLVFNNEDIMETTIGTTISSNAASEQNKITDLNTNDADPENLDEGMVSSDDMVETINSDTSSNNEESTDSDINTYNNSDYVDENAAGTNTEGEEEDEDEPIADCDDFNDGINYSTRISNNFTLGQLSSNAVVSKYPIKEQKGLSKEQIACNLKNLATDVLDSIKNQYSGMVVTSGFRHGSGSSQHYKGQAADMQFFDGETNKDYKQIADWIRNNVPHDQLLLEYKTTGTKKAWIHVSYTKSIDRNMDLTFYNDSSRNPGGTGLIDLAGSNGIPV